MSEENNINNCIKEKALLIGIYIKGTNKVDCIASLEELKLLAETSNIEGAEKIIIQRESIMPTFVIGTGKAEEILKTIQEKNITLIIFDLQLTPIQDRNLRNFFKIPVLDRIELVLNIFANHAKSHEAKIQIELAQLKYLRPRLKRMWTHLSRQSGGAWLKGPGETQIEIDKRRIKERIAKCYEKLEEIKRNRHEQRKNRNKSTSFQLSLIGYTNAGKSSLINRLTDADTYVENKLFCTLDTLSKKLELENKKSVVISDTVGFIRNLPHFLVESFKATLEVVIESDALIHVIDGNDPEIDIKIHTINSVIKDELKIQDKYTITVINKIDLLNEDQLNTIKNKFPNAILLSSLTGFGISNLLNSIINFTEKNTEKYTFLIPMDKLSYKQYFYKDSVIYEEKYEERGLMITASVNDKNYNLLKIFEI